MSVHGTAEVLRNLRKEEAKYRVALRTGMEVACQMLVNYIKVEYSRPTTGKGFTDRTGNLRNSISYTVTEDDNGVVGWVHAGMEYAVIVELHHNRTYAYLLPALNDKRKEILNILSVAFAGSRLGRVV